MTRATLSTLAALAALALAAAPAAAQSGTGSNTTGPIITGSGPAGGSYQGAGLRSENELFGRARQATVFRNAALGCAARATARSFVDSLAGRSETLARARVRTLMGIYEGTPPLDEVAAALAHGAAPSSPLGVASRRLAVAVDGLLRNRCGCPGSREEYPEAPQWQEALRAFNAYVHDAPAEALAPPAPELLAIHEVLFTVVKGTLRLADAR